MEEEVEVPIYFERLVIKLESILERYKGSGVKKLVGIQYMITKLEELKDELE